jgi:hypothetical protein
VRRIVGWYKPKIAVDRHGNRHETRPGVEAVGPISAGRQKGEGVVEPVLGARERGAGEF